MHKSKSYNRVNRKRATRKKRQRRRKTLEGGERGTKPHHLKKKSNMSIKKKKKKVERKREEGDCQLGSALAQKSCWGTIAGFAGGVMGKSEGCRQGVGEFYLRRHCGKIKRILHSSGSLVLGMPTTYHITWNVCLPSGGTPQSQKLSYCARIANFVKLQVLNALHHNIRQKERN